MRIGNGFDVHRLEEGIPLIIGGVRLEYERGLKGHSDGDVLTHAIMNALLGAAALGDIGVHFPPGDPKFKGADSQQLLKQVKALLDQAGYRIENIDSMIVCERPKLSPHYGAMRKQLSDTLGLEIDRISVKAATAEGLGSIGAGIAIAAQAVALIERQ